MQFRSRISPFPRHRSDKSFSLSNSVDSGFIDLVVAAAGPVSLTWDNAGGATPSDGRTWDISGNKNWNNGSSPNTVYTDGSNVIFNDTNDSGSNANAYYVTLSTSSARAR